MARGELSWSKVRLLVGVADADNERQLAHASVDATVADVDRICKEFRWKKAEQSADPDDDRAAEDIAADLQFRNRGLTWRELPDGSTTIRITLPPEKAQVVLKSLSLDAKHRTVSVLQRVSTWRLAHVNLIRDSIRVPPADHG